MSRARGLSGQIAELSGCGGVQSAVLSMTCRASSAKTMEMLCVWRRVSMSAVASLPLNPLDCLGDMPRREREAGLDRVRSHDKVESKRGKITEELLMMPDSHTTNAD
eukprot:1927794-Rhodomonas_salina.1